MDYDDGEFYRKLMVVDGEDEERILTVEVHVSDVIEEYNWSDIIQIVHATIDKCFTELH